MVNFGQFEVLAEWQPILHYQPHDRQAVVHMFLEQLAHGLWELGWAKGPCVTIMRNLCSNASLLIAACDHRGAKRWTAIVSSHLLQAPFSAAEVIPRGFKGLVPFPPLLSF